MGAAPSKCPKCGKEIPDEKDECPACGYAPMLRSMMRDSKKKPSEQEIPEVSESDNGEAGSGEAAQSQNGRDSREEGSVSSNDSKRERGDSGSDPKARSKKRNIVIAAASGFGAILVLVIVLFATHIICFHGKMAVATCAEPPMCVDCGYVKGEPLGHVWKYATCTEPKTCSRCGTTEGKAPGHTSGEWSEWDTDYDGAIRSREVHCANCENVIDIEREEIASFVESDHLTIYPAAFAKRFDDSFGGIKGYSFYSKETHDDGKFFYDESNTVFYEIQDKENDYGSVGMYSFSKADGESVPISKDFAEGCASGVNILIEKASNVSPIVFATVLAIDPGLSYDESAEVGQSIIDNVGSTEGVTKNSLHYTLQKNNRYHYLVVGVV